MEEEIKGLTVSFIEGLGVGEVNADAYSPLTLAYMGDCVYELIIRTSLVTAGNIPPKKLHKKASALVKASAQSDMIQLLLDDLTETETAVYKRGRNAKSHTMAKNATMPDYKRATGFEALVGYLYLTGDIKRLMELVRMGLERFEEKK